MTEWVLIPCLKQLFAEFNMLAPDRDKRSDGSIGDTAHQKEVSDHNPDETGSVPIHDADKKNEVHAIDVDNNLNVAGLDMERVVQWVVVRCRMGLESRLRYVIYNRRIWSASSGWVQKTYTGSSPHTEHAHFSASYETAHESSTASWRLEGIPVALTIQDKEWLVEQITRLVPDIVTQLLNTKVTNPYDGKQKTLGDQWRYIPSKNVIAQGVFDRFYPPETAGPHPEAGNAP